MINKEQKNNENLNVNECAYYDCGNCNSRDYEQNYSVKCAQIDCYFKDYARKTQECEQKDKVIEELMRERQELQKQLRRQIDMNVATQKECEELKEEQNEIKKFLGISHKPIMQRLEELHERSDKYKDRILELEQECEELKKELNGSEKWRIKAESLNEKLELNNGRYRKALEEIERELKEDIYCESQECGCDDYEECLRCTKNIILDIINKAGFNKSERSETRHGASCIVPVELSIIQEAKGNNHEI